MSKTQKIWMWIFLAMFLIPEILWSPILNVSASFLLPPQNGSIQIIRNNFLFDYKNENLLKIVVIIQIIAAFLFFLLWVRGKNHNIIYWIVLLISILILLVGLFIFYLIFFFNTNFIL